MFETKSKHRRLGHALLLCAVGAFTALSLCSCVGIDGDPPSSDEVARYVASNVKGDRYELVDCKKTGERPKEYTYEYRSTDRDLSFTARAYLAPIHFDASIVGYDPSVDTDYADSVHALYDEEMMDIIDRSGMGVSDDVTSYDVSSDDGDDDDVASVNDRHDAEDDATCDGHTNDADDADDADIAAEVASTDDDSDTTKLTPVYETDTSMLVVTSYDEIEDAVDVLLDMDDAYRAELTYNSQKWCDEHPYARVSIRFMPENDFETGMYKWDAYDSGTTFDSVDVDCTIDRDDALSTLQKSFAQAVANGTIDAPMPDEYDGTVHPQHLDVYVDGEQLEYRNERGTDGILTGGDGEPEYSLMFGREGADWSDKRGEYIIEIDVGNRRTYNEDLYPDNFNGEGTPLDAFVTRNKVELCVIPMLAEPGTVIAQATEHECTIQWTARDGRDRKLVSTTDMSSTSVTSLVYTDGDGVERRLDIGDSYSDYRATIRVSDFADMFGLDLHIDENERTIDFESPESWNKN